jgi:hypothetical protein
MLASILINGKKFPFRNRWWLVTDPLEDNLMTGSAVRSKNDSGANSIIPIPTLKYRISARVIVLSFPNGSSGLNVLHINRKSSTRAFDRYTVVNMTNGVIFVRQTDDRQIVEAPFLYLAVFNKDAWAVRETDYD